MAQVSKLQRHITATMVERISTQAYETNEMVRRKEISPKKDVVI